MKRTLLFALTVAMSAVLCAAVPTAQTQVREINPTIRVVEHAEVDFNTEVLTTFAQKATNATVTDLSTYYVPQSFNSGTPSDGIGYVGLAQIVVPYAESVAYVDGYGIGGTWTVGGEVVANNAPYYVAEAGQLGGEWELPVLKTNDAQLDDTTTVVFSEYQFGAYYTSVYAQHGFYNSLLMAPAYLQSMTKCAMYTEVQVNPNNGKDTYGNDWTFVTSAQTGGYWYGTQMYDPRVTDSLVYFDEMMVLVDNAATMYIDHVSLGVYTMDENNQIFKSEDDHVTLTLYPTSTNAEGQIVIDYENPYATAVATIDDYMPVKEGSFYGLLNFYFEEPNALGIMSEVPAIVEGTFAAVLSEYNEGTANFGIITDYYTPYPGDTYLSYGDKKWTTLWKTPGTLLMNFYALFPTVLEVPAEVKVALEGGQVELALPSNVWYEDMEIDADEWIAEDGESLVEIVVEEGQEYEDFQYQISLTLDVEAADAPRAGVVEINALGHIYTINVLQGDVQSGVENVEATTAGKTFNLLGVEVDENYKGIVIKNGQKYIQ